MILLLVSKLKGFKIDKKPIEGKRRVYNKYKSGGGKMIFKCGFAYFL